MAAVDELLTIPETAAALGISRWTVYRLIADGALDATDVRRTGSRRGKTRVPASSLDAFIAARTRNAGRLRTA